MEEFDIYIRGFMPARPGATVDGLRRIFGLDALRAQEFVQSVPRVVKRRVSGKRAEQYERALKEIGAVYELRPCAIRPTQIISVAGGVTPEDDAESDRSGRTLNLPAPMLEPAGASVAPPPAHASVAPRAGGSMPAPRTIASVPAPAPGAIADGTSLDRAFGSVRPPEPGFPSVAAPPMTSSVLPPGLVGASTVVVIPPDARVPTPEPMSPASLSTATLPEHAAPLGLQGALASALVARAAPAAAAPAPPNTTAVEAARTWFAGHAQQDAARTAPEYTPAHAPVSSPPPAAVTTKPIVSGLADTPQAGFSYADAWPPAAPAAPAAPLRPAASVPAPPPAASPVAPPVAAQPGPVLSAVPSSVWAALEPAPPPAADRARAPAAHGALAPPSTPSALDLGPGATSGQHDWLVAELALRQQSHALMPTRPAVPMDFAVDLPPAASPPGVPAPARGRHPGAVAAPSPHAQLGDPEPVHERRHMPGVVSHSPGLARSRAMPLGGDDADIGSAFAHVLSRGAAVQRAPMSASVFTRAARAANTASSDDEESLPLPFRIVLRVVVGVAMFAVLMTLRQCDATGGDVEKTIAAWDQADFGRDRREVALDWMSHNNHMFVDPDKDRVGSLIQRLLDAGAVQVYATELVQAGPTWISRAILVEMPQERDKRRAVLWTIQGHGREGAEYEAGGVPRRDPFDDGKRTVKIPL